jgi:hypothetical protein
MRQAHWFHVNSMSSWKCPYCSHAQLVSQRNSHGLLRQLAIGPNALGDIGLRFVAIACLNPDCKQVALKVTLHEITNPTSAHPTAGATVQSWALLPESSARIFPDYIPAPIRDDYVEACRILNLSPKASATLARRCLQGMIRDFCGISKGTLDAEIKAPKAELEAGTAPQGVTHESVEAIDHVRKIGNIGAHMEKDINLIIDIDEGEAAELIGLIELLCEEWYIARSSRSARLARIKQIRDAKQSSKNDGFLNITDQSDERDK